MNPTPMPKELVATSFMRLAMDCSQSGTENRRCGRHLHQMSLPFSRDTIEWSRWQADRVAPSATSGKGSCTTQRFVSIDSGPAFGSGSATRIAGRGVWAPHGSIEWLAVVSTQPWACMSQVTI